MKDEYKEDQLTTDEKIVEQAEDASLNDLPKDEKKEEKAEAVEKNEDKVVEIAEDIEDENIENLDEEIFTEEKKDVVPLREVDFSIFYIDTDSLFLVDNQQTEEKETEEIERVVTIEEDVEDEDEKIDIVEIESSLYELFPPQIQDSFVWDLSPPEIIEASVEEDDFLEKMKRLMALLVENSSTSELENIQKNFLMSSNKDTKATVFDYFGVDESYRSSVSETEDTKKSNNYRFSIENAHSVRYTSINKKDFIFINGSVTINFDLGGNRRTLKADSILFDVDEEEILAVGNISISSSAEGSQLQDLTSEGLFINFNSDKIHLIQAIGTSMKKSGSDKNVVTNKYYMYGDNIIIDNGTAEIYFDNGSLLTSSNPKNANWQITADKMLLKSNGDVFLSNILLKVGRVPILPLPAFFMPGRALSINPSIGFSSDRGAFVNTTYELIGNYPSFQQSGDESNSFTNLFKSSGSGAEYVKDGILYVQNSKDKTKSKKDEYTVLFTDFYERNGLYVGMQSNSRYLNSRITLNAIAGIAYMQREKPKYFGTDTVRDFRYYLDIQSLKIQNIYGVNLSLVMPIYSDPYIKRHYFDRLTVLNFDSLLNSRQDFPTSYQSSSTENNWTMNMDYALPSKLRSTLISSATINASMSYNRYWTHYADRDDYYFFDRGAIVAPRVTVNVSGTVFSLKKKTSTRNIHKEIEENFDEFNPAEVREHELLLLRNGKKDENNVEVSSEEDELSESDLSENEDIVENAEENISQESNNKLIPSRYKRSAEISSGSSSKNISVTDFFSGSRIGLTYSITNTFTNNYEKPLTVGGKPGPRSVDENLKGALTFNAGLGISLFSISAHLIPNYVYSERESSKNLISESFSLKSDATSKITIPFFSQSIILTHTISNIVYTYSSTKDDDTPKVVEERVIKWDKKHFSTHLLSTSLNFFKSKLSLYLSANLPPLDSSAQIKPQFTYSVAGVSISGQYNIKGDSFSKLKSDRADTSLSYSGGSKKFSFTEILSISYDFAKERNPKTTYALEPFTITNNFSCSALRGWISLSNKISFDGINMAGVDGYFTELNTSISVRSLLSISFPFTGRYDNLKMGNMDLSLNMPTYYFSFWKNRIVLSLGFNLKMKLNFTDALNNSVNKYTLQFGFYIREFITISFTLNGSNKNFLKYTNFNRYGTFSFKEFIEDIIRGVNIFDPNMGSSNFKMDDFQIGISHNMKDWSLTFTYRGGFVQNGNEFEWKPTCSINLHWSVIPELKVNRSLKVGGK